MTVTIADDNTVTVKGPLGELSQKVNKDIKVEQVGGAACHEGYHTCFFRKVVGDNLEVVGERVFDPKKVYKR